MNYDFSILTKAGITPGTVAKLVGVTRVTASQWVNGHTVPHRLLSARVQEFLRMVQLAVDYGMLPLKDYPGRRNVFGSQSEALVRAVQRQRTEQQQEQPVA